VSLGGKLADICNMWIIEYSGFWQNWVWQNWFLANWFLAKLVFGKIGFWQIGYAINWICLR